MTTEQQRIAIAEWMGFVNKPSKYDWMGERGVVDNWSLWDNKGNILVTGLPDYPHTSTPFMRRYLSFHLERK